MECERRFCVARGKRDSTDSAIRDATQDVFHLACAQFGINGGHRGDAAEGTIRVLQPAQSANMVSEVLVGECYDAGQAIQAIRFVTRQPSAETAALKAARREVQRSSQFFERQTGGQIGRASCRERVEISEVAGAWKRDERKM